MAIVIGLAILFFALGFLSGHLCTYEGDDAEKRTEMKKEIKNLKNAYQGLRLLLPAEILDIFEGKKQGTLMTAEEYFEPALSAKSGKNLNKQLQSQQATIEKLEVQVQDKDGAIGDLEKELENLRKGEKPEFKKLRAELSDKQKEIELRDERISDLEKVVADDEGEITNLKGWIKSLESELAGAKEEKEVARVTVVPSAVTSVHFDKYIGARGAMNLLNITDEEEFKRMTESGDFPDVAASFGETKLWLRKEIEKLSEK